MYKLKQKSPKFIKAINALFFIIISSAFHLAHSQEHYVFSLIDNNDGLSEDRVRCITQLPDGRMVIMTEGLVNLYNGSSFQYLHVDDQNVYPLTGYHGYHHTYIDREGQLWAKDYQKLLLFDIKKECFVSNMDSVLSLHEVHSPLTDFFMDSEHNFWYLTQDDELIYRNTAKGETQVFLSNASQIVDQNDQLLDMNVYESRVFMFYKSGLMICFNLETREEIFRENPFEGDNVIDSDQVIFIIPYKQYLYQVRNGSAGYLLRYDIKKKIWETVLRQDYWLNTISLDQEGNIWLSSSQGLWYIDKNLRQKRHVPELQLVDGRVFKTAINVLFNDNQGGLWLGTSKRGLLYYHPDRFKFKNISRTFFELADELDLRINCFAERENDILIGTPIGLFSYTQKDSKLKRFEKIPLKTGCYMMLKDKQNRIWISAGKAGLYCIAGERIKHYDFPSKDVFYIYENTDGSLYISLGNGLCTFDPVTGHYEQIQSTQKIGVIYQMAEYRQQTLIGLSNAGIFTYDRKKDSIQVTGTYEKERPPMFRQSNYTYDCLYSDSRGLVWLGTRDGLGVWDPEANALTNFHSEDGLIKDRIQSIIEDHRNDIWVSTSGGISKINVSKNEGKFRYGFSNFNKYDGVIANEFFERSVYCSSSGSLFWGGINGFNEINPENMNRKQHALPKPLFTKLFLSGQELKQGKAYAGGVVLDQSVASTQKLDLTYDQNFITFEFSALNYVNPTQTFYRYKMEGIDEDFQEIIALNGIGRVNYTNLAPGNYILKVYAGSNNKEWSKECAEMAITINPPFWKTPIAYGLYLILFFSVFYLSTVYYLKLKKQKMLRQQKEDMDKLKFRFFTNVSHELRTPLTLIITPLDSMLKKMEDSSLRKQLQGIYRNANDLLRIVNQLLDFRKLEVAGESLQLSYCRMDDFLSSIHASFQPLMQNKDISFTLKANLTNFHVYVDKDKFQKIINNLILNAYKFTPKNGEITLLLDGCTLPDRQEAGFVIQVIDNGKGIPEKELANIFTRFYQLATQEEQNTGSGIGLHLAQEYAQMHNGFIKAESQSGEGSTFTVYIPAGLQPEAKIIPDTANDEKGGPRLKLLIVEDNDEFKDFLSEQFSEEYAIITATDGEEGLNKALSDLPDLIISDIMMPKMDGIELCRTLKKNIQTSHIPIILLTARSSNEAQFEGYESGADAYISKPFNMDLLYIRINNLLEQQKQRRELFKKAIIIQSESLPTDTVDERLIKKAIALVEKNLSNPRYSVEQLSKDMNMDRTGLYRKLVAVVDQTPTVFIRSIRLKKAAQYLKQGMSVSEVADLVGFGTISYFSKCFQEEFGIKPSNYSES